MSERDNPQNQGNQGGQQPRGQGGQPQGGPQQPPQGGPQQPPQGGRPPAGGGSLVDRLQEPEPKRYIVGITGTFAVLAVAMFLMVLVIGAVGGQPMVSEDYSDLSDDRQELSEKQYVAGLVSSAINIAPFLVLTLVALAGGAIGMRLDRPQNEVLATAGAAAFAGALVFVILGTFLVSTQYPSGDNITGQTVRFGPLILNSIATGIGAAVTSAGAAFLGQR